MDTWLYILGGALLAPYWLGPPLVYFTQKVPGRPVFLPLDEQRDPIPGDALRFFRTVEPALVGIGFEPVIRALQEGQIANVTLYCTLLRQKSGKDWAMGVKLYAKMQDRWVPRAEYVEFYSKGGDGFDHMTNNNDAVDAFVHDPATRAVEQFPMVQDVGRLHAVHRELVARRGTGQRDANEERHEPIRMLEEAMRRGFEHQVPHGILYHDAATDTFRPTWVGAWRMCYKLLPPGSVLVKWLRNRRARRLLEEIGR